MRQSPTRWHVSSIIWRRCHSVLRRSSRKPRKEIQRNLPRAQPVTGKYDLKMFSPYKLHQRAASSFRVGRALLAGDAAHACNPFGGMGLTGGLCDAGGLSDCLIGVLRKGCGDDLLDKYAEIRKKIFLEVRLYNVIVDFRSLTRCREEISKDCTN